MWAGPDANPILALSWQRGPHQSEGMAHASQLLFPRGSDLCRVRRRHQSNQIPHHLSSGKCIPAPSFPPTGARREASTPPAACHVSPDLRRRPCTARPMRPGFSPYGWASHLPLIPRLRLQDAAPKQMVLSAILIPPLAHPPLSVTLTLAFRELIPSRCSRRAGKRSESLKEEEPWERGRRLRPKTAHLQREGAEQQI